MHVKEEEEEEEEGKIIYSHLPSASSSSMKQNIRPTVLVYEAGLWMLECRLSFRI